MKKYFNLSLKQMWLLVSIFALVLPIFMPSSANPQRFLENVIGSATVTMFILSFPSSVFGLPLLLLTAAILQVDLTTIEGLYLNLFLLFVLGFVQWFWIYPRIAGTETHLQITQLPVRNREAQLLDNELPNNVQYYGFQSQTPLERVFEEKDSL